MGSDPRIAVIGGGFSGLMTAYLLERELGPNPDIVVMEKTPRLGGRITTAEIGDTRIRYDAGAAEFYEILGGTSLRHLAGELGLTTQDMVATPFFAVDGHRLVSEDDLKAWLGQIGTRSLRDFWQRGSELRPPAAYVQAGHPSDNDHPWFRQTFEDVLRAIDGERARWFTAHQAHSDVATEPAKTSGLFGFDNLLIDHPEYARMFTIEGGNELLVDKLREAVTARILLSTEVTVVRATGDGTYDVVFRQTDAIRRFVADFVVLTPPPLQLRSIRWEPSDLADDLRRHIEHHDYPAHYLRVTLLLHEKVWDAAFPEDYFVSTMLGGTTVYDKTTRVGGQENPMLSVLVAGQNALEMARAADSDVVEAVVDSLPKSAGIDRKGVRAYAVDRWLYDLGVSRLPGGQPVLQLDRRHEPSVSFPNVFTVGDYLYDTTINGALDAVMATAERICDRVEGLPHDAQHVRFQLPRAGASGGKSRSCTPGQELPFVKTWSPAEGRM